MDDTFDTIGRFGYISAYDPAKHFARVYFPDLGIVSAWLPLAVWNSKDNHDEHHLDIDEHVYCLLHDNTGIILGSVYDDKNKPPIADENIRAITFNDGTTITYDRKNHITDINDCNGNNFHMDKNGISISSSADISISAKGHMTLSAARIDLN